VILEAVRAGEPAVIFCKLGKDRTGLISALVLACCAATEEEIVSDYIRSASFESMVGGSVWQCPHQSSCAGVFRRSSVCWFLTCRQLDRGILDAHQAIVRACPAATEEEIKPDFVTKTTSVKE
jgi:hypothetical protein